MELILGLAFIFFGSGTICFVSWTRHRHEARVAMARDRLAFEGSDNHTQVRLRELAYEHEREQRLLGDGK